MCAISLNRYFLMVRQVNAYEIIHSITVLVSAGRELIFFLAAGTMLSFGLTMRMLMTH